MNCRLVSAVVASWLGFTESQATFNTTVKESAEETRPYALMGDPSAQFNLSLRYRDGLGVKKNAGEALNWLRKAAARGHPQAQHNLAVILANGDGVKKDEREAVRWFRAAAEQGVFEAQKALIVCYARGMGVEKSAAQALKWDFLARRTLELLYQQPAGAPPKPPKPGPDGAVDYVAPDGRIVSESSDGRRITKDANGTVETVFPNGTRQLEGDGQTPAGRAVRITDRFDKNGKRISRRIVHGAEIIEELADGERRIETTGEDEQGRVVRVIRRYAANGAAGSHRLVREDGVERTGEESWVLKRWVNRPDGQLARMRERYGLGNMVTEAEVLELRPWPAKSSTADAAPPAPPPVPAPPPTPPITGTGIEVFQSKVSIGPQLTDLTTLARSFGNYAGATAADYERARSAASSFVPNIAPTPQKASPGKSGATALVAPAAMPLKEIPTDRSDVHPLGLCGRALVKGMTWKHAETEHFVVHYTQEADAKPVMRSIECTYLVVAQALRLDPAAAKRKMHVFIFADTATWIRFTKALGMPPQVGGFAYKDELLLGAHDDRDTYLKTLCHEAAHAIVAHFYPGRRWPLWLTEGFADYVSAKARALAFGNKVERYLARPGPFEIKPVFTRLRYGLGDAPQIDPNNVLAFYAQSEKCVRVLLEKLPASAFPRFANLAFAGNSMSAALREAYGDSCPNVAKLEVLVNSTP